MQDWFRQEHYQVESRPLLSNAPIGGNEGLTYYQEFRRRNESYSPTDALLIHFSTAKGDDVAWTYDWDITNGDVIRKKVVQQTDVTLSFEAVGVGFEYKVGQKVGMAVYRNYEFDFSNDEIFTNNDWDKSKLSQDDIVRLFGKDNSVSIYTGAITAVSTDQKVFRHDINTFKGCSGAIVFLLDKNQDGLVEDEHNGKSIGVHAGAFEQISTTGTESTKAKFNLAFALAGYVEKVASSPVDE